MSNSLVYLRNWYLTVRWRSVNIFLKGGSGLYQVQVTFWPDFFLMVRKMNGIERANRNSDLKVHEIPLVGVDHDFPRLQYLEVLFD